MYGRLSAPFRAHWFFGVYAIVLGLWLVTTIAWFLGADGVTFTSRYGTRATIDFSRKYDRPVVALGDDVGLEVDTYGPKLHGTVVRLGDGLPVVCYVCGSRAKRGGVAMVDYRRGDWLYRAPRDESKNGEAHRGRAESKAFILTLAYNRATHERVVVDADAPLADQERALASRGLAADEASRLSSTTLADLAPVSMQREGCVIVQAAFAAAALLWLVVGGPIALVARARKKRAA